MRINYTLVSIGIPRRLRWWRICLQCRRPGFNPWVGRMPWRREQLLTPVFLPGEFHGQRSLAGPSPWGHKESAMTNFHFQWVPTIIHSTQQSSICPLAKVLPHWDYRQQEFHQTGFLCFEFLCDRWPWHYFPSSPPGEEHLQHFLLAVSL